MAIIRKFDNFTPDVERALYIAENAAISGDVVLEDGVTVWYGAALRGDTGHIHIGRKSNIQDGCVVHCDPGHDVDIGERCTIGHGAIVHGCTIGDGTLVGMGAIILNGAKIGRNCIVGAGALVTQGKEFPDHCMILGSPAKAVKMITGENAEMIQQAADEYLELGMKYLESCSS